MTHAIPFTVGEAGIELEDASWPRGIYSLAPAQGNDFRVFLPDAEAGSFEVFDGEVLIFESSAKAISGSIVIRRAMRWHLISPQTKTVACGHHVVESQPSFDLGCVVDLVSHHHCRSWRVHPKIS